MTVFLSYAHQDKPTVDALAQDLDGLAGSVWLDTSLSGGQDWWDEILRQIRECRLFVLAVSRHALSSEACLAESSYATSVARPLLAVRVDKVDVVAAPAAIRRTQLIDYLPNDADSIRKLAKAVIQAPAAGVLPQVVPSAPPIPQSYRDRFADLFRPDDLSTQAQVNSFTLLKLDLDNGVNADEALELLRVLYDRRNTSWRVREDIGRYLAEYSARSAAPQPDRGRAQAAAEPLPEPGWYADPMGRFDMRYWDSQRWTEHVARGGQSFRDPIPGS